MPTGIVGRSAKGAYSIAWKSSDHMFALRPRTMMAQGTSRPKDFKLSRTTNRQFHVHGFIQYQGFSMILIYTIPVARSTYNSFETSTSTLVTAYKRTSSSLMTPSDAFPPPTLHSTHARRNIQSCIGNLPELAVVFEVIAQSGHAGADVSGCFMSPGRTAFSLAEE